MKKALLLAGLFFSSCSRAPQLLIGDDPSWLPEEEMRQIGIRTITNRYPHAQVVSEQREGRIWSYRFATNGMTLQVVLVVDQKTGIARFESLGH